MTFRIINGIINDNYGAEWDCLITPEIRIRYDYDIWNDKRRDCQLCFYFGWLFWLFYVRFNWTKS